jgi:hypothetical protein
MIMRLRKYLIILLPILIASLYACSPTENTATNEMDGIELKLSINNKEISLDDDVFVEVTLTNNNDSGKVIFVPTPKEIDEGIAAIMVERKGKGLSQLLSSKNEQDNPNIKERSFYDFVKVELGPNETIEQEFYWDKELFNQESREIVDAENGKYILSSFIILDELTEQKEYYEPEKQLITKLNFLVK